MIGLFIFLNIFRAGKFLEGNNFPYAGMICHIFCFPTAVSKDINIYQLTT
jgi:hypothetical protein